MHSRNGCPKALPTAHPINDRFSELGDPLVRLRYGLLRRSSPVVSRVTVGLMCRCAATGLGVPADRNIRAKNDWRDDDRRQLPPDRPEPANVAV
jgi:hypothetical protein